MLIKSVFIKKHNRLVLRLLQFLCVMSFDIDVEYLSRFAEANVECHHGNNFSPLVPILQVSFSDHRKWKCQVLFASAFFI